MTVTQYLASIGKSDLLRVSNMTTSEEYGIVVPILEAVGARHWNGMNQAERLDLLQQQYAAALLPASFGGQAASVPAHLAPGATAFPTVPIAPLSPSPTAAPLPVDDVIAMGTSAGILATTLSAIAAQPAPFYGDGSATPPLVLADVSRPQLAPMTLGGVTMTPQWIMVGLAAIGLAIAFSAKK